MMKHRHIPSHIANRGDTTTLIEKIDDAVQGHNDTDGKGARSESSRNTRG